MTRKLIKTFWKHFSYQPSWASRGHKVKIEAESWKSETNQEKRGGELPECSSSSFTRSIQLPSRNFSRFWSPSPPNPEVCLPSFWVHCFVGSANSFSAYNNNKCSYPLENEKAEREKKWAKVEKKQRNTRTFFHVFPRQLPTTLHDHFHNHDLPAHTNDGQAIQPCFWPRGHRSVEWPQGSRSTMKRKRGKGLRQVYLIDN